MIGDGLPSERRIAISEDEEEEKEEEKAVVLPMIGCDAASTDGWMIGVALVIAA